MRTTPPPAMFRSPRSMGRDSLPPRRLVVVARFIVGAGVGGGAEEALHLVLVQVLGAVIAVRLLVVVEELAVSQRLFPRMGLPPSHRSHVNAVHGQVLLRSPGPPGPPGSPPEPAQQRPQPRAGSPARDEPAPAGPAPGRSRSMAMAAVVAAKVKSSHSRLSILTPPPMPGGRPPRRPSPPRCCTRTRRSAPLPAPRSPGPGEAGGAQWAPGRTAI